MTYERPALDRFLEKFKIIRESGCWEWQGTITPSGYGMFWNKKDGHIFGHRFSYRLFIGPVPEGLQIDHLCRNRKCVNPAHLEAVTGKENSDRGFSPAALNGRKTHCLRGHEFQKENNRRRCNECKSIARYAKQGKIVAYKPRKNKVKYDA